VRVRMGLLPGAIGVAPGPVVVGVALGLVVGGGGGGVGIWGVGVAKGESTYEVADYDAALSTVSIFEADHDHAVASQAPSPSMNAVLNADTARDNELLIAARANIVVGTVACGTVVTGM